MSKCLLFAGAMNHGKSYVIKTQILRGKVVGKQKGKDVQYVQGQSIPLESCNIFDITREYSFFYGKQIFLPDFIDFKQKVKESTGKLNIFEESSSYFSKGNIDRDMNFIITQRFHRRNALIFPFGSMRRIPVDILDVSNALYIFKTGDNIDFVRKKFKGYKNIVDAWIRVQASPNKYYYEIVKLLDA